MVVFAVEGSPKVQKALYEAADRYDNNTLPNIVYEGGFRRVKGLWVIRLSPRLPRLDLIGFCLLGASIFFHNALSWLSWFFLIPGLVMASLTVFWLPPLYLLAVWRFLRRRAPGASYSFVRGEALVWRLSA